MAVIEALQAELEQAMKLGGNRSPPFFFFFPSFFLSFFSFSSYSPSFPFPTPLFLLLDLSRANPFDCSKV